MALSGANGHLLVDARTAASQSLGNSEKSDLNELLQVSFGKRASLVKKADEKIGGYRLLSHIGEKDDGEATLWVGKNDNPVYQSQQRVKACLPEGGNYVEWMVTTAGGSPPRYRSQK